MKVSVNWLKRYVDIDVTPEELCERMTMQGFEVEGMESGAVMRNVVAAKITAIEKHPDSDHLQICQLDIGRGEPLQIVTGADNVFVGATVPAALNDSDLPNGTHIKNGKLRGIPSYGMMCSGEELGLKGSGFPGSEVYGILILDDKWAPGTDMNTVIGTDDCVIDFSITANRPDCNSVLGIAREVAVALGKPVHIPQPSYTVKKEAAETVTVTVLDTDKCPRYIGAAVENIRIAPSPKWMCDCLLAAGMRPINNIVDITNFVMLETGQPMHAFDISDIAGKQIIVRCAANGEQLTTLDGKTYSLTDDMLVIADGERAVGLAGIMGGENSEIKGTTSGIFFESAKFRRDSIRRTARALGIRTEASARYEKGVDVMKCRFAMDRALSLIQELDAGDITSCSCDVHESLPAPRVFRVPVEHINRLLGIEVPVSEMLRILNLLDIPAVQEGSVLVCPIPAAREDMEGEADIAEEIIRVYGYDHIDVKPMTGALTRGKKTRDHLLRDIVRQTLVACSCREIATYSFISAKAFDQLALPQEDPRRNCIRLLNPLGEDYSVMRTQLVSSMLSVLALNSSRGAENVRLFEVSKLFLPVKEENTQPEERPALCIGLLGKEEDFFTLKAAVETVLERFGVKGVYARSEEPFLHPGRQAAVTAGGKQIAILGEVHPAAAQSFGMEGLRPLVAQLDLAQLYTLARTKVLYAALPKYPAITRDLAVVVDEASEIGPMLDAIASAGGSLVDSVELFDIYRSDALGEGKMSVAFSITMRHPERTLKDEEANKAFQKIVRSLEYRFGATIRA